MIGQISISNVQKENGFQVGLPTKMLSNILEIGFTYGGHVAAMERT